MKKLKKVIGFCGLAGSGKNEAANAFAGDKTWTSLAFADAIKRTASMVFGWDGEKDKNGRILLQDIGMAGRKYDPNIWIKHIDCMINAGLLLSNSVNDVAENVVITDVRFENEASYIQDNLGGIVIRVIRPGQVLEKHHMHVSEVEQWRIRPYITIQNEGTIEQLHNTVLQIVNNWK